MSETTKNTECSICHKCAYKGNVPRNSHIRCSLDWSKSYHQPPKASEYGTKKGWYIFPVLFDPIWQETPCQEFSTEKDSDKVSENSSDPYTQLLGMIRGNR